MTNDDALYRFRLGVFALAQELGNVRAACRVFGIHHSTYYRWRALVGRYGTELLRPRERRRPQMPNATSPMVEQRVLAYSLAHPGQGPDRIAAELRRDKWGGIVLSANGVWRVLRRHGLSTRGARLALVAGYAAHSELPRLDTEPQPERHLEVEHPGELVQFDCFCIGRLSGTKGTVWQYTAIDVYSAYTWAELHATARNPLARHTSELARRVARDLAARGWRLEAVTTDNGSEFRSGAFRSALPASASSTASSTPDAPRPTAAWSGSSAPSSTNAGSRPSPATSSPNRPGWLGSSSASCGTTTPTGPTTVATPEAGSPRRCWARPRCSPDEREASPHLGENILTRLPPLELGRSRGRSGCGCRAAGDRGGRRGCPERTGHLVGDPGAAARWSALGTEVQPRP